MDDLLQESSARDFVADAFARCKFIGYVGSALPLFAKAGIAADDLDEGCVTVESAGDAKSFVDGSGSSASGNASPMSRFPRRRDSLDRKAGFDGAPTRFGSDAARPTVRK